MITFTVYFTLVSAVVYVVLPRLHHYLHRFCKDVSLTNGENVEKNLDIKKNQNHCTKTAEKLISWESAKFGIPKPKLPCFVTQNV